MLRRSGVRLAIAILLIAGGAAPARTRACAASCAQRSKPFRRDRHADPDFDGARRLAQQGKYDDALTAICTNCRAAHPETKGLAHEFGVTYYKKNDFVNAIASLKKAQEENPDDGEAVQLLGLVLLPVRASGGSDCAAGKSADVVSQRQRGCRLHPGNLLHPDEGLPARARRRSRKCSGWRRIRRRAICSPRACCCGRILARWRKNTRRKAVSLDPEAAAGALPAW